MSPSSSFLLFARFLLLVGMVTMHGCTPTSENEAMKTTSVHAADILGNADYPAISYGGYRATSRDTQPTLPQLREDLLILHAMGIRVLRTYNVQLAQAKNVLATIQALREEDPGFEMYVMLGAWIDAKNAWTGRPVDHTVESEKNAAEIDRAVALAKQYPDIVKVIAVGNEAMVKWATSYYVQPGVILKWVRHLQRLKAEGELAEQVWITSSDNFASWGGGGAEYHVSALNELIRSVDYVSMHTYPMHDTHYNPSFWGTLESEGDLPKEQRVAEAMRRSLNYAQEQYRAVADYVDSIGADKPIHIGETGWASSSNGFYGAGGSEACDEFKQALYHEYMREWTQGAGISCFYFEAFDEPWKDAGNPGGSENYFGLFTVDGRAKYALWPLIDAGTFEGLTRGGNPVAKTYGGDKSALMEQVAVPSNQLATTH